MMIFNRRSNDTRPNKGREKGEGGRGRGQGYRVVCYNIAGQMDRRRGWPVTSDPK